MSKIGRPRYNWKTSKSLYEVFCYIYALEPITGLEVARKKGGTHPSVYDQIHILKKEGLITQKINPNRKCEKCLSIDKEGLKKKLGFVIPKSAVIRYLREPRAFSDWINR